MSVLQNLLHITNEWEELIDNAQCNYVFGDPLDLELFKKCMNDAYLYFTGNRTTPNTFDKFETMLYGQIYGYSCIPAITYNNSPLFKASLNAAGCFAHAILHPETVGLSNGRMVDHFLVNDQFKTVIYDFESGDLKDYIELVEIGFWD